MSAWLAIGAVLDLAAWWLARPFLAHGRVEDTAGERALSVFHEQREALARDAALGLIGEDERRHAEREVQARAARAARDVSGSIVVARRRPALALAAAALTALGSVGLYLELGSPGTSDQPLAARRAALERQLAGTGTPPAPSAAAAPTPGDATAAAGTRPDTFEAWWARARSHAARGEHAAAANAYRRAAALSGDAPAVVSAYAEALTLANGNKVPEAARLVFEQVLSREPREPRARYYLALARAQAQDFEGALEAWQRLLADSAPEAPWIPLVRRDIANMARFLERDPGELLPAPAQAAAKRQASGPDTVSAEGAGDLDTGALEAAVKADPENWQAWIALAHARAAAGDPGGALAALTDARSAFPGAPFVLARLDATAAELGLAAQGTRGPSVEQVAAAGQMSEPERERMVRGMVEGLAGRLRDRPQDIDGWLMLIRSYAVLQERELAVAAAREALAALPGDPARSQVLRTAATLGLVVD